MRFHVLGCSHRTAPVMFREQLAFSGEQARSALGALHDEWPEMEAVLLSTCNRVELYSAAEAVLPSTTRIAAFLGRFHGMDPDGLLEKTYHRHDRDAIRHLFLVASSLDSMVVGESQILGQVKQAYQLATEVGTADTRMHAWFQASVKVARRVAGETTIQQRRVSIPSIAVADFAQQIFDCFDDKQILVVGAGEMAEETLKYLQAAGAQRITVVNRNPERARELASRWGGVSRDWRELVDAVATADVVIGAAGAPQAIITQEDTVRIGRQRPGGPIFILDLAVPRNFDSALGKLPGVYLYTVDDLQETCDRNRRERDLELPVALGIVDEETDRFLAELNHRVVGPVIRRLRDHWQRTEELELDRLFHRLPTLDEQARGTVRQSFDRLVNQLMHPPLESLRVASRQGVPRPLLDALATLFRLGD